MVGGKSRLSVSEGPRMGVVSASALWYERKDLPSEPMGTKRWSLDGSADQLLRANDSLKGGISDQRKSGKGI
ncbi:hypothetical protein CEXT_189791 [Caerostris extrusa]|uniref:Uncharacterized protein n=1 Tax=Caerostris extrusa TaxID=172846 RepID=A0AAV4W8D5_CAEEX|nr:hypothetical protein CEXT_189791 [Caerostris extrusa]